MAEIDYTFGKDIDWSYEEALEKVPPILKDEGFGVLTEIDVKGTLKEKLDVDFKKYKILGACNPKLAYTAFQNDLEIGALLPCNVIVYEQPDGRTRVAIADPMQIMQISGNEALAEIATEARERLQSALEKIG